MLYPLKFKPLYKDYIWGGRNLETLGKPLPDGKVAESWELSCHPDGQSIISNGIFEGILLNDLINKFGTEIIGNSLSAKAIERFPLLVKFIDANDRLSVQVHPKDEFSIIHENGDLGKNEMWYIISAKEDAKIVYGVIPGTTKESFAKAIIEGNISEYLNYIPVKSGDFLNIPAGLVHAIGEGIVLAEVQQNSNTTYRVFDYDRIDKNGNKRPLHIDKALEVIDFNNCGVNKKIPGLNLVESGYTRNIKIINDSFAIEEINVNGNVIDIADGSKFYIYIITEGSGKITFKNAEMDIKLGDTILIPAYLGEYEIEGDIKAIRTYVPENKGSIIKRLMDRGFIKEEIIKNVAGIA